jgi:tetratricopeptide (TPR) repeat protein
MLYGSIEASPALRPSPEAQMTKSIPTIDELSQELIEVIRYGNAALVIGAGASVSSGAPTGQTLVGLLHKQFPLAPIVDSSGFLDAGTEVCDSPPYGRLKLIRFLKDLLSPLEPSDSYKQLPRARWHALFTTNYDDLLEKAYLSPSRVQSIQPVNLPYSGNVIPRADHVLSFYLQGSIKAPETEPGSPVVSWGDYLETVQDRQAAMDTFRNVVADGANVIYVGYSFADRFLFDLLDEALRRIGNRNMPYGYAILPDWPTDRASAASKISRRSVQPVEGTFEQFAELIKKLPGAVAKPHAAPIHPSPAAGVRLTLATGVATLSPGDAAVLSEGFELVDDDVSRATAFKPDEESRLAREFLKGESFGWLPYANKWAFQRSEYKNAWNAVTVAQEGGGSKVVLVHGPAGLGKSVMARQLAVALYKEAGQVVLLATPRWRARPDYSVLARALDDIESSLPEGADLPPICLIVDEAELLDHTVADRIVKQARSAGRAIAVLLFARTNEFFRAGKGADGKPPEKWGEPLEIELSERISYEEITLLMQLIARLRLWDQKRVTDPAFWKAHIDKELDSSFFDAVFSLVEQTQVPLRERVWSEYERLGSVAQQAYLLIAGTHQFGLPLKMEMLVRALGISFADFESQVIRSDARQVLFSEYGTNELNLFYRARTRLIAKLVFDRALPNVQTQLDLFKRVVGAASPSSMFGAEEVDLVRTLLVHVLGPSGFDDRFVATDVSQLFDIATRNLEDDVLEHHFGLIERHAGNLESAKLHLENALRITGASVSSRESIQNIENSLADVLGQLAIGALKAKDSTKAEEYFAAAGRFFLRARTGEFPNAAAYDAHARLVARRAKFLYANGSTEHSMGLADAVEIVSAGIDNVNEEFRVELVELRANLLTELGLGDHAVAELIKRSEKLPPAERARYETIIARILLEAGNQESKHLRRALPHATKATELDSKYFDGWRLRSEIFARLHPTDFAAMSDLLESATACQGGADNLWVLYELAVCQFYLSNYSRSGEVFKKLSRASRGHGNSGVVVEIAGERTGEPFEFEGRIVRRATDGFVGIVCTTLEAFGHIWFNAKRQKYYSAQVHDKVTFLVGMNYRGVQSVDLRKL